MLSCRFKGFPGEHYIKGEFYILLRARRPDQVITRELWEKAVLPGAKINMSMIIWHYAPETTCPRCKTKFDTASKDLITIW